MGTHHGGLRLRVLTMDFVVELVIYGDAMGGSSDSYYPKESFITLLAAQQYAAHLEATDKAAGKWDSWHGYRVIEIHG